jgi:hypothetical protein
VIVIVIARRVSPGGVLPPRVWWIDIHIPYALLNKCGMTHAISRCSIEMLAVPPGGVVPPLPCAIGGASADTSDGRRKRGPT